MFPQFENVELPAIRPLHRYMAWDDWSDVELSNRKVLVVIGEHRVFSERENKAIEKFCEGKVDGALRKDIELCQSEVHDFLENANQKMADLAKEKTNDVLDKVLFAASSEMKNAFARSDA